MAWIMSEKLLVGGQAVLEGVMMKSKHYVSIVVKNYNKKIVTKNITLSIKQPWMDWLFVRGVVNLFEMLVIGIKALIWSANQATSEKEKISSKDVTLSMVLAVVFAVCLFVLIPFFLARLITTNNGFIFNLLDGIIRVIIFMVYLIMISLMKDVKTLFEYHGAEHCAVNCYESEKKLTLENAEKFTTVHPRCGTSFLIIVLIISILVFSLIPSSTMIIRLLGRIILLPVIAGISYEILKLSAKFRHNKILSAVVYPGILIQKITTQKPNKEQIKIALCALQNVLILEKRKNK